MERECKRCGIRFTPYKNRRYCDDCDELKDPNLSTVLLPEVVIPKKDDNNVEKPKKIGEIYLNKNMDTIIFIQSKQIPKDPYEYFDSYMYPPLSSEFRRNIINYKVVSGKRYDVYRMVCVKCKELMLSLAANRKYCLDCAEIQTTENKRLINKSKKDNYKLKPEEKEKLLRQGINPHDYNLAPGLGTGSLGEHRNNDDIIETKKVENELKRLRLKK